MVIILYYINVLNQHDVHLLNGISIFKILFSQRILQYALLSHQHPRATAAPLSYWVEHCEQNGQDEASHTAEARASEEPTNTALLFHSVLSHDPKRLLDLQASCPCVKAKRDLL